MAERQERDRYTALAELKQVLGRALSQQGWTQASLKRHLELQSEALGKGTISEAFNVSKGAPSLDTLNKIAEALEITGGDLENLRWLHRQTTGRSVITPWTAYLRAARRAAQEHPYPGVIPGTPVPPLATVYLDQQTWLRTSSDDSFREGDVPQLLSGERLLTLNRSCVILAGAGGGKSSLLRMALTALADCWLAGQVGLAMPVLVPAAALLPGKPFSEAVAEAVSRELSAFGLSERFPAEAFREPPAPGARWLILIDGFDEIIDVDVRRRLLTTLTTDDSPDSIGGRNTGFIVARVAVYSVLRPACSSRVSCVDGC